MKIKLMTYLFILTAGVYGANVIAAGTQTDKMQKFEKPANTVIQLAKGQSYVPPREKDSNCT